MRPQILRATRALSACLALAAPALACSSVDDGAALGSSAAPIINGKADTSHPGVVFIGIEAADGFGGCTGSIVDVDTASGVGLVLTAGHCVTPGKPSIVLMGNDINSPSAKRFEILDYAHHSKYPADPRYDFGMIRILGVDASTPKLTMVPSTNDGVAAGVRVTNVGYGLTHRPSQSGADNSVRNTTTVSISSVQQIDIHYSFGGTGTCSGDSGGPALITTGGSEKIVGVVSRGDQDCAGDSIDARISYGFDFINQQLALPAPTETCDICTRRAGSGNNVCAKRLDSCLGDTDCKGLYDCLVGCSGISCQIACSKKFPAGNGPLLAWQACSCSEACATKCAGSSACAAIPACVGDTGPGTCGTCTKSSCCAETAAAARDKIGNQCLTNPATAGCSTNTAYQALVACRAGKCAADCGPPDPGTEPGTDPGTDPEETVTTTTTTGCSVVPTGRSAAANSLGATLAVALGLIAAARRRSRP
jgi:hypothetical protein